MAIFLSIHWVNQIKKYIEAMKENPYVFELKQNFKNEKVNKITSKLSDHYKVWIKQLIKEDKLTEDWIDNIINILSCNCINLLDFNDFLINHIKTYDQLLHIKSIHIDLSVPRNNRPVIEFKPSPLKMVTMTAISYLNTHVNLRYLYEFFTVPKNLSKLIYNIDNDQPYFDDSLLGKIIGCKTENFSTKGFFKKEIGDMYNCNSLCVVIDKNKCPFVKVFNNGKIHMTGIASVEQGMFTVQSIISYLNSIPNHENRSIVTDKSGLTIKSYETYMINTCFVFGISINREILYLILKNRYKLDVTYDSEGYPGVRVEYFYHERNINTKNEGKCSCNKICEGKGNGSNNSSCRKISIAIFQSGSCIIAGGCDSLTPIYHTYNFIVKLISEIIYEVKKDGKIKETTIKKKSFVLDVNNITNYHIYSQLVSNS